MKKCIFIISVIITPVIMGSLYSQSAELSGTLFTDNLESDVRAGGTTIRISLTGVSWSFYVGFDHSSTRNLINAFKGDQNWEIVTESLDYTHVERVNNSLVVIRLPEVPDYFLSSDETVKLTIPPSCLSWYFASVSATPEIMIRNEPARVRVSGSIEDGTANGELDIRKGNSDIVLTLAGDRWEETLGTNSIVNENLIRGLTGSPGWNADVINALLGNDRGASHTSLSGNEVAISIPAVPEYNIYENDNITINVPADALIYTQAGTISGEPILTIVPEKPTATINDPGLIESMVDGSQLTLSLREEQFLNSDLSISGFSHNGPEVITLNAVNYISETEASLRLGLTGPLTEDVTDFRITISEEELRGSKDLITNGISILDEEGPTIVDVTIPEGTYIIGDTVEVQIEVVDDQGNNYDYYSGTVAGKTLSAVQRLSSVLYIAYFVVEAGDPGYTAGEIIPVNNLQLISSSLYGNSYNGVVNNNTIIDTQRPLIDNMRPPLSGNYKVGEQISIIVSADGEGYSYVESETWVNEVSISESNVSFQEMGDGLYLLKYTVQEGDKDVSPGELTASLQLKNSNGNTSLTETRLFDNSLSIDANSPVVVTISVRDSIYSIGDVVVADIEADGNDYTATDEDIHINGVPLTSPNVSFVHISGNNYELHYEVRSADPEVAPGDLEIVVYLQDQAGNTGGPYDNVESNSLSIYTTLPTASLSGTQSICEGELAELTVNLTGRSPWRIYLSDGDTNTGYLINSSPDFLSLSPLSTTVYGIDSVVDVNGISNSGTGEATVTVNAQTSAEIINLNASYYVEADSVQLEAEPSGGIFSGPGVNSETGVFDPGEADTLNSPHTLYYTYTNSFGCISTDSALVFVLGAEGDLHIPKEVFCDYGMPFTVSGSNVAGDTGSFQLFKDDEEVAEGLTDHDDNSATIDPSVLGEGIYTLEYRYFDETWFFLKENFSVESVEPAEILIPDEDQYCKNLPPFEMVSSDPEAVFSGLGVSGNVNEGFVFIPDSAPEGQNTITLTRRSENGCENSVTKNLNIIPIPELNFTVENLCIGPGDSIHFINTTEDKDRITNWVWNFDDPDSEEDNTSTEESPSYIYENPGIRNILLTGETEEGCVDSLEKTLTFEGKPAGSFFVESECYEEGKSIVLTSMMISSNEIVNYEWTITDPAGEARVISGESEISFAFDSLDVWTVHLQAETGLGCTGESEREIHLKPVIPMGPAQDDYFEDFDLEETWWSAEMADSSDYMSWDYNQVTFSGLNDASSRAWYTNLPSSEGYEYSWVKSPCFDFTVMERPMISMDIYRSLSSNTEGLVLQSTTDGGKNWETIGSINSGINWYNSDQVNPSPDKDATGWSGEMPFAADEDWVNARHQLDKLGGKERVQFRIAFTSQHESSEAEREGFAFDNIRINERNRKILLEHFTNTSDNSVLEADGIVNSIYNDNFKDLIKLEYHTSFPGEDPFNAHNSSVPAIRTFYYDISDVPYTIIDGGFISEYRVEYGSGMPDPQELKKAALMDSPFEITVDAEYDNEQVLARAEVTALMDLEPAERIVHLVVYEKLITGISTQNGADNFINVVKDMLPNSAGTAVFDSWERGQTRAFSFSWEYSNVYDPDRLRIASFIQNEATQEVYQAASDDSTNLTTSIKDTEAVSGMFNVYPNPATETIFIHNDNREKQDYILELYDQLGRIVLKKEMYRYEYVKRIDISGLEEGVYILQINNGERGVKKVLIRKR